MREGTCRRRRRRLTLSVFRVSLSILNYGIHKLRNEGYSIVP